MCIVRVAKNPPLSKSTWSNRCACRLYHESSQFAGWLTVAAGPTLANAHTPRINQPRVTGERVTLLPEINSGENSIAFLAIFIFPSSRLKTRGSSDQEFLEPGEIRTWSCNELDPGVFRPRDLFQSVFPRRRRDPRSSLYIKHISLTHFVITIHYAGKHTRASLAGSRLTLTSPTTQFSEGWCLHSRRNAHVRAAIGGGGSDLSAIAVIGIPADHGRWNAGCAAI